MPYLDSFNRPISYLRISVTDRCNLRCVYCMPPQGIALCPPQEILRYEEIALVVRAAAELGISKVRITGGEPLVRLGIVDLVAMIAAVPGIDDVSMTTNGTLLTRYADDLARAGLRRVNVSLDTLREERFRRITRYGRLTDVLAGIEAAQRAGLRPIKTNMVVLRGLNDDEVVDFARLTLEREWHVRYIEMMPVGQSTIWSRNGHIPVGEIKGRIEEQLGELQPARVSVGSGPARYYRLGGAVGTIGFISPISEHFCQGCNRLRLTADGRLRPCLLSDEEMDLRTPLRRGASLEEIRALLAQGVHIKPQGHRLAEHIVPRGRTMSQIGG
ncbi:MAG: GTP 3',8-cyclase MoaA [Anaerolineae bacterium]